MLPDGSTSVMAHMKASVVLGVVAAIPYCCILVSHVFQQRTYIIKICNYFSQMPVLKLAKNIKLLSQQRSTLDVAGKEQNQSKIAR